MKAVILFFILTSISFAQEFECSGSGKRSGLFVIDTKGKKLEVVNFKFEKAHFFESYINCIRFLDKIKEEKISDTSVRRLFPLSEDIVRIKEGSSIIKLCYSTPGCRFPFPYSFLSPVYGWLDSIKDDLFEKAPTCNEISDKHIAVDNSPLPTLESISFRTWSMPKQNLAEVFFTEVKRIKPTKIIMSSMVVSLSILNRLNKILVNELPNTTVDVYVSFNMHSFESHFPNLYRFSSDRIRLIPMHQTPSQSDTFHIKGIYLENATKNSLLFFSANIRRFRDEKVIDIGITFNDSLLGLSFKAMFENLKSEYCRSSQYLQCSLLARYSTNDSRSTLISNWNQNICKDLKDSSISETPILRANKVDLYQSTQNLIASAKKEIIIATHVMGNSLIVKELINAKKRGINVTLFVTNKITSNSLEKKLIQNLGTNFLYAPAGYNFHSKFLIVDNSRILFGTGNFTKTAMMNPWEIYLLSMDSKLIEAFKNYLPRHH